MERFHLATIEDSRAAESAPTKIASRFLVDF
jgi:hypothetical protein